MVAAAPPLRPFDSHRAEPYAPLARLFTARVKPGVSDFCHDKIFTCYERELDGLSAEADFLILKTWYRIFFQLHLAYFFSINELMAEHNYLGEFELMILLTILRLGDEAYGVPLSRELSLSRGRRVSVGSVYAALDRLETKGLIASSLGEATPERGGRAKRYFRLTEQGLRSIHETRSVLNKLWKSLPTPEEFA